MSGYTPVFRSVFEGSLCGQYPDTAAWLFMLALADKNGCVDKTAAYIAAVTGMPITDLESCIARFLEPDPQSRSDAEDGRRLVLIDPVRPWGWRIVNHEKYREKARLAAKSARETEDGRNAERMKHRRETAADRREPPPTDPSNANANADRNAYPDSPEPLSRNSAGEVAASAAPAPQKAEVRQVNAIASRKRRGSLGHFVPEDFAVPEEDYRWAIEQGYAPDFVARETERFCDHEFKTPRSDWIRAWRNWISRDPPGGRHAQAKRAS